MELTPLHCGESTVRAEGKKWAGWYKCVKCLSLFKDFCTVPRCDQAGRWVVGKSLLCETHGPKPKERIYG